LRELPAGIVDQHVDASMSAATSSTSCSTCSGRRMSQTVVSGVTPVAARCRRRRWRDAPPGDWRSRPSAPHSTSAIAIAFPIPVPPPVTIATFTVEEVLREESCRAHERRI